MFGVLFVCSGNICRSPTAEGVFRAMVEADGLGDAIVVDSAGTGGWHVGEEPDKRSQQAALERGIDLSGQRARQVHSEDFERFDMVLAMDRGHYSQLMGICPDDNKHRIRMFLEFAPSLGLADVPDPYYGAGDGFAAVLDMVEAAAASLLAEIRANHL